jgi:uncharacterized membrane protein
MTTYTTTFRQTTQSDKNQMTTVSSPVYWLRGGWNDITAAPMISLLIGGSFTLLCAVAYAAIAAQPVLTSTVLAVLLLISPFIAATAYFIAQQHEQKRVPSLRDALGDVRSRALSIGLFSILCTLILGAWVRVSSIAFALYYGTLGEGAAYLARTWTAGFDFPAMLFFLTLTGLVLALTLFAIGAIALPMIADQNSNVITAVHRSFDTLSNNAATMMVWIVLLAAAIATALLSGLILMPVVFPLLAYATWHSYRQLAG